MKEKIIYTIQIALSLLGINAFWQINQIYNYIRANGRDFDPDYHMNTLPYDYTIIVCFGLIIILSIVLLIGRARRKILK